MSLEFPDFSLEFDPKTNQFFWIGFLQYNEKPYFLKIIYPNDYPFIQPKVFVSENETFNPLLIFKNNPHRFMDDSVCLFPWDNGEFGWKIHFTVINSLEKFLDFLYLHFKNLVPTEHYSSSLEGFIKISTGIYIPIKNFEEYFTYSVGFCDAINLIGSNTFIISNIMFKDKNQQDKLVHLINFPPFMPVQRVRCLIYFISFEKFNVIKNIYYKEALHNELNTIIKGWTEDNLNYPIIFVGRNNSNSYNIHCVGPNKIDYKRMGLINVYIGNMNDEIWKRTKDVLNININEFDKFTLCFIGLGSLGSEISLQLTKSGFNDIFLIDNDNLEPINLSRHVLDLRSLHKNKAQEMAILLVSRNFNVQPKVIPQSVLTPNTLDSILNYANKNKKTLLLINTTNDLEVDHFVNDFAIKHNITSFYASCSINVELGRIFRVIPNKTPCFACIGYQMQSDNLKMKFNHIDEKWDFAPYRQGIPGIGLDVSIIANITAKMILETIMDQINPDHNYKTILTNHLVIVLKPQKNSKLGFYKQEFSVNRNCPICSNVIPNDVYLQQVEELKRQTHDNHEDTN